MADRPKMKSGTSTQNAINVDDLWPSDTDTAGVQFVSKSWKGLRPKQQAPQAPATSRPKRKAAASSSSRDASAPAAKRPRTAGAPSGDPPPPRKTRRARQTVNTAQRAMVDLCESDEESASTPARPTPMLAIELAPRRSASTMNSHTIVLDDDDDPPPTTVMIEDEKSPSPELAAFDDAYIYENEDAIEPVAPSRYSLCYAPVDPDERSPSPAVDLPDELVYSLSGLTVASSSSSLQDDYRPKAGQRSLDARLPPQGGRHGSHLRWTAGPNLLLADLTIEESHNSHRMRQLFALRRPYSNGTGLDALDVQHKADEGTVFRSPSTPSFEYTAAGSVGDIIQRGGWIAAGCATGDGYGALQPSRDPTRRPVPSAANRPGALAVFNSTQGRWRGHGTHCRDIGQNDALHSREEDRVVRYYSVEAVAFDPLHEARLVSCGMDGSVVMWEPSESDPGEMQIVQRWDTLKHTRSQHAQPTRYVYEACNDQVAFSPTPDVEAFAVASSKKGLVYIHRAPYREPEEPELVELPGNRSQTLGLEWGRGVTARVLFAGIHGAFRVDGNPLYRFRNLLGGEAKGIDTLVLDPVAGNRLAMVTYNNDNDVPSRVKDRWTYINPRARFLHLYDVTASRADLIFSGELDFPCSGDRMRNPSITCASFSPDGVLLALGCSDNSVYVYDARFLRADGPAHLHRFRHSKRVSDRETYGVTAVEWAPTRGIMSCSPGGYGLYSGGADGAVRVFNTGIASESQWNGNVVAQMQAGIGTFSIGDPSAGEKMLVVGDNDGKLGIWDKARTDA